MPNNQYLLVVAAGKTKVIADAVRGEQFAGGGVAMRLQVGKGLKAEGQIANEQAVSVSGNAKVKIVNGRRYLWVGDETGSHIGPHWAEQGFGPARNVVSVDRTYLQHITDHFAEGSLADRHYNAGSVEAAEYGH